MIIQTTEDYSLFNRIKGNRMLNKSLIDKLYRSIGEHPEIATAIPLLVNEKLQIIDGQHRFEALKQLQMPINYFVLEGLRLSDVQRINSATKVWSPYDYAKSYSELGNKNYDVYLEFRRKYRLVHNTLLYYLADMDYVGGGKNTVQTFRQGKLKIGDIEKARKLCEQLNEVKQYYKRGDTRVFAGAFKKVAINPQYNHKRMLSKVMLYNKFFKDSPYEEDYMRQLEKIYNYKSRSDSGGRARLF